ncbi:epimerase [Mycolicibacterium conceptionense]|uniref:Epimerase n=2 Tax=Mycolicibacterium conceptionense TaxID=451644 RepID=A0A1A2VNJ2_9MYCO|nr:epimerase [Mycolicibacterium conceptionense]OBE92344.1 epimerase [Mycolicibacterium conceptionense]OBF24825.1 epimerase [Mycolicibacterium conceptionense]OBF45433.1 epimerase [Mycolicibacterium conceptionense]OBI02241.1 epimerase [Mycolicibacterium conceptionense]
MIGQSVVASSRVTTEASSSDRFRLAITNETLSDTPSGFRSVITRPTTRYGVGKTPMRELKRALVTGGGGFLGGHLCQRLLDDGVEVLAVDDLSTSAPSAQSLLADRRGYQFIRHDITVPLADIPLVDTIFHLASPASPVDYQSMPVHTLRTGALGTGNVLDIADRCGARMVLASTSEVYGDPLEHPQRETYWGNVNPVGPRSMYDESKRFAEALAFAYRSERSTDVGVARLFNTYGPRMRDDDGRIVPTFCRQALAGEPITVHGTGHQTRSLCYVDDTVDALLAMARADCTGPINIGNPRELSVLEIAETIRDLAGSDSPIRFLPAALDDPQRRCPDITEANHKLGWQPAVDCRKGLVATLEWFAQQSF